MKKAEKKKVVAVKPQKIVKEKKSKVELVTYTIRAIIPTGMYSNIQPEVTVKAETLEVAERAVMPHIERLFAKYRDTSGQARIITEEPAQLHGQTSIVEAIKEQKSAPVQTSTTTLELPPVQTTMSETPKPVMSVPFGRAAEAINSCTSLEALKLISAQVERSEKLVEIEKMNLRSLLAQKEYALNKAIADKDYASM